MTNINPPTISAITGVLPVQNTDEAAIFLEKIGFERTQEVSEDPSDPSTPLGFVIMVSGNTQVMFQSIASIRNDSPDLLPPDGATAFMFVEVDDLDKVIVALAEYPVFMQRRETFYGSKEIGIESPSGHKFTFAQFDR